MRFNAGRDALYGSMRMLADQKDEALELLRLAVEQAALRPGADRPHPRARSWPASSPAPRIPSTAAQLAWAKALYGEHPYARRDEGTQADTGRDHRRRSPRRSIRRLFARDNLIIGVVGAIDAETLKRELDQVFGEPAAEAGLAPVADISPKLDQEIRVPYDLPQTSLQLRLSRRRARRSANFSPRS